MTSHCLAGDPPISLILRRSGRARRISLRISQLDGRVTLTVPSRVPEAEALAFAREKEAWIRRHLDARPEDVPIIPGAQLPILGNIYTVSAGKGRRVTFEDDHVCVPGPPDRIGKRLGAHLKALARTRLAEACDGYASRLGLPYKALTLRDTRSRWGSCTSEGRLMFSWRLVLAPDEVLAYVAAHEVAHLKEMNHSAAFWAQVAAIHGPYEEPRAWLRREGGVLHSYRFGD